MPTQPGGALLTFRLRRLAPLYPPTVWNVHEATVAGEARTENLYESWNFASQQLVGHSNPSIWTAIDSLRKDQALAATSLLQHEQGIPMIKRTQRSTKQLQIRLQNICIEFRNGKKDVEQLLIAVGHSIRYKQC